MTIGLRQALVDAIGDVVSVAEDCFEAPPSTLSSRERELITGAYKLQDRLLLALDIDRAVDVGRFRIHPIKCARTAIAMCRSCCTAVRRWRPSPHM